MHLSAALRGALSGCGLLCTCSCDRIPGTSSFREAKAERAVAAQLLDPSSAQFRNVQTRGGSVCGEVNAKNKMGAYVGFRRFVVDTRTYAALVDPQIDFADVLSARELCSDIRSSSYSSVSTTVSACSRASELEAESERQHEFDRSWEQHCGGAAARQVYRPPLGSAWSVEDNSSEANEEAANVGDAEDAAATQGPDEESQPDMVDENGDAFRRSPNMAQEPTQEEPDTAFPPAPAKDAATSNVPNEDSD